MRILSEASGVLDAPIRLKGKLGTENLGTIKPSDFVDYLIAVAAARAGSIAKLKNSGLVDSVIWKQISDTTFRTINEPEKDDRQRKIGFLPFILGGFIPLAFLGGFGLCKWLQEEPYCPPPETTQIQVPSTITTELDSGTSLRFNNAAIGFEADSAEIPVQFKPVLDEIGQYLQDHPDQFTKLIIEGHTSTEGSNEHNMELSLRRANAIVDYLNTHFTIKADLLEAQGYGEESPIYNPEVSDAQKDANRRVIIRQQL